MKRWRIVGLCLLLLVIAGGTWSALYGKAWLERKVRRRLNEVIDRATVEGYHFHMDSVCTSAVAGDLSLAGVRLDFDTALVDSLRNGTYRYLFSARVDRVVLRGISYWKLVLRGEFSVERLEVDRPSLRYVMGGDRVGLQEPFGRLSAGGSSPVRLFNADTLVVRNAGCTMEDLSGHWPVMSIEGLDLTVEELALKAHKAVRGLRVETGAIALGLRLLHADVGTGYRLRLGPVHLARDRRGSIDQLSLTPSTPSGDLAMAITRTAVTIGRIDLRGIDIGRSIAYRGLWLDAMDIRDLHVEAELDRTLPDPPPRPMELPAAAVQHLGFPLRIDTLRVIDGSVHYRERSPAGRWGDIPFSDMDATFTHLTNDPGTARKVEDIEGNITCTILDSARLEASYSARLDGSSAFSFDATVHELPFTALNRLTDPLLQLHVDGGQLHTLHLLMKGDERRARGSVAMTYDGLLLRVSPGTPAEMRHSLFGSIMDDVLREEHGGGLTGDRQRNVAIERDPDRSMLTYIWHFTRAGLSRNLMPAAIERVEQVIHREKELRRTQREQRRAARR